MNLQQTRNCGGMMTGVYFSGTGNTKFCVDRFLKEYNFSKNSFSIESKETLEKIKNDNEIVAGCPFII